MSETETTADLPPDHLPGANNPPSLEVQLEERWGLLRIKVNKLLADIAALPAVIETDADHEKATNLQKDAVAIEREVTAAHQQETDEVAKTKTVMDVFFLTRGLKGQVSTPKDALSRKVGAYLDKKAEERRVAEQAEANRLRAEADARLAEAAKAEDKGDHTQAEVQTNAALATERQAENAEARAAAPTSTLARTHVSGGSTSSLQRQWKVEPDRETIKLEALRPYLTEDALVQACGAYLRAAGLKAADPEAPAKANKTIPGANFSTVAVGRAR